MESFRYFSTGFPSLFFQIFSLFRQASKEFLYFVIGFIDEVGFAEGFEGFFEVGAGGFDGVVRAEVGFDLGVVAGFAVDFIEVDDGSLPHTKLLAATGDFGMRFEAELEDDIDQLLVVGNLGLFNDIDT